MLIRDVFTTYRGETTVRESWDFMLSTGFYGENASGFNCLETMGDDFSLADAQLVELDDLIQA